MKRFLTAALIICLGNSIVTNAADIEIYTDKEIYVEQSKTEKLTEETTEIISETKKLTEETTEIISETEKLTEQTTEIISETEKLTEQTTEIIPETEKLTEQTTEVKNEEGNSHKTDININNNNIVNINDNKGNIYITIINGVTVAVNDNGDIITDIDISDINSIDILNKETTTTTEETEITTEIIETTTINKTIEYEKPSRRSSGGSRKSHSSSKSNLPHKTENSTDKVTKSDNKTNSIKTKSDKKTAVLSIGSNKIDIDGTVKVFDSAPYISDKSYTLLPLRAIASLFDNTQVSWDGNTKTAKIISDENTALFTINSDIMIYNGKELLIPQSAELKDNRTYVPIRAICEALGVDVAWDSPTKTITITK